MSDAVPVINAGAAMAACRSGFDGLVFTPGIGEHSPEIRARIARGCAGASPPTRNR